MAGRKKPHTKWKVVVVSGAMPEEAEAAARQARRMVAQWILQDSRPLRRGCWPAEEGKPR